MGMGEPLANLDGLLPALEEACREDGLGISARRITISTVGLPKAMRRLADTNPRYRLAVSLHAPNDALRREIVPVSEKIPLAEILAEADHYFDVSGRRLTFEYVLLGGINDSPEHAAELAELLGGRTALVNVIPYNPVHGPCAFAIGREMRSTRPVGNCGEGRRAHNNPKRQRGAASLTLRVPVEGSLAYASGWWKGFVPHPGASGALPAHRKSRPSRRANP
jgi:hypothetical protein